MKRDVILIIGAIIFWMAGSAIITHASSDSLPVKQVPVLAQPVSELSRINIPAANISVSIKSGGLAGTKWLMSERDALYWVEGKAVIIYGHNSANIFARLNEVKPDDELSLTNKYQQTETYKVISKEIINADEISKVTQANANVIIFTCTGWWDEKRVVLRAIKV